MKPAQARRKKKKKVAERPQRQRQINVERKRAEESQSAFQPHFLVILSPLFVLLLARSFFFTEPEQHFSYLAESFLHGKVFFLEATDGKWDDTAPFEGKFYWPQGPFPALLILPFVWIFDRLGAFFFQGYLSFFLVISTLVLIYRSARRLEYDGESAFFFAFAFATCSYLGVALVTWSWYFAHVVAVSFLWLAIHEWLGQKRYGLIGVLFAGVTATRLTAGLGIIFFALDLLFKRIELRKKTLAFVRLLSPVIIMSALLAGYNFVRFGNFLETGYSFQLVAQETAELRKRGILSLAHVPMNFYWAILGLPIFNFGSSNQIPPVLANPWGMSIFLTSPYLVLLFWQRYPKLQDKFLLLTSGVVAFAAFLFFGVGYRQFGYRFSLDFLPLLFLLLMTAYKQTHQQLSFPLKILLVVSAVVNLYLWSTFVMYDPV
ncbi:MAG: hypothetical protein HY695_19895 [Deltaproteobacteria bacterium]|nr:hypothetical protein [Deltaproteobacteria bacterium]